MDKFLYYNDLFSIYKKLLTEKEQEIFSDYYEENLSMGEISENRGVSRSAIGNTIKIVENKLESYEQKLKIAYKNQKIREICDKMVDKNRKEELETILKY